MIWSVLIWFAAAALTLYKTNQRDSGKHKRLKAVHSLFVILLILTHSAAFKMLGWVVGHPDKVMESFYVPLDLFAPWANFGIWMLNIGFSLAAIFVGFALARRISLARRVILWMIPFLCLVDWLEAFKGAMGEPAETTTYLFIAAVISIFTVIPYTLMFIFYTRHSVASALFRENEKYASNQAVEATS